MRGWKKMASRPVDAQAERLRREMTGDHDFVCGGETAVQAGAKGWAAVM